MTGSPKPRWHDVEQNGEEWRQLRQGKATASNFACFMANETKSFGEPAKRYALQIALEQLTGKRSEHSFSSIHMERGHLLEPVARALYERETFTDVTNGGFFCWGAYGDSPDGLVGEDGGVEIKCVIASTHYATMQRGTFDPSYRWQLAGHLDCTGREWFDFVSYCEDFPADKQLIVYRLHRADYEDEIKRLRERRAEFLQLVHETLANIRN